jgi:hypothetical protein
VAVSLLYSTEWAGPGFSGDYSPGMVTVSTPGCSGEYELDPAGADGQTLVLPGAPAPRPGSAKMNFVGTFAMDGSSGSSCSAMCASEGFNIAWDAIGPRPPRPVRAAPCRARPRCARCPPSCRACALDPPSDPCG